MTSFNNVVDEIRMYSDLVNMDHILRTDDICIQILKFSNQKGLDLKTYSNQALVSKRWRILAINSVTMININDLMKKSKYREYALLAQILCDYHLHKFPNLSTIMIKFPIAPRDSNDLYNYMRDYNARYNHSYLKEYVDNGIQKYMNNESCTFGLKECIYQLSNCIWYYSVDKLANTLTFEETKIVNIDRQLFYVFNDFKNLSTLVTNATSNTDISFYLKNISNLKHLIFMNNTPLLFSDVQGEYKLETLVCKGGFKGDFINLAKLPYLRKLHTKIEKDYNDEYVSYFMENIVEYLNNVEILYIETLKLTSIIFKYIVKLQKLKELGIICGMIPNSELYYILGTMSSELSNLKTLKIYDLLKQLTQEQIYNIKLLCPKCRIYSTFRFCPNVDIFI